MIGLGRAYSITFIAVAVSAQQDFFYIKPAADKPVVLESLQLSNVGGAADAGDAQEELYDLEVIRLPATVTVGSGGTTPTPNPLQASDTAAGFTARANDTTKATSSGTLQVHLADGWNVRIPYVWMPPPEHRIIIANAQAVVVRLNTTPADAVTVSGTLVVRELA